MNDRLNDSFTCGLFRPYLDLGPAEPDAPHHCHGVDFGFRSFDEDRPYPRIQSALNPSFRAVLISATGLTPYGVSSPAELPEELQTQRWRSLCHNMERFTSLPSRQQVRLAWTVAKMCFQQAMLDMVPESFVDRVSESDDCASLAYLRAYSRCRMQLDAPDSPYALAEFERIANEAPPGIARVDATYQMVVQNVKDHNDLGRVEQWQARHLDAIERSLPEFDEFTRLLLMSRYYRVGGFIPQMKRERGAMVTLMDEAERYARELPRNDAFQSIAADEMLYPVLESRTKEALWLEDYDLALERALQTVKLSPHDARAYLHLGQVYTERDEPELALAAYRSSVCYAPPGQEIAWFMAGQCYECLGDLDSACDAYLASLEADPLGIAAAERLQEVAAKINRTYVKRWVDQRLSVLKQQQAAHPVRVRPQPYKSLPPPITSPVA